MRESCESLFFFFFVSYVCCARIRILLSPSVTAISRAGSFNSVTKVRELFVTKRHDFQGTTKLLVSLVNQSGLGPKMTLELFGAGCKKRHRSAGAG